MIVSGEQWAVMRALYMRPGQGSVDLAVMTSIPRPLVQKALASLRRLRYVQKRDGRSVLTKLGWSVVDEVVAAELKKRKDRAGPQ